MPCSPRARLQLNALRIATRRNVGTPKTGYAANGGAMLVSGADGSVVIEGSTYSQNIADRGGAIIIL